ncbi:NAD-dependent epimerase/dehydratase family protein [Vibrio nigripulchritudo]|uniref:NAD-dependent epimerase/dehydratase family protein n=1 Tax=Vibrio nigripulchritudo TaxID=28173 RepID=UPI0005FA53B5|nr:NAD-dependent epimerase/dehydratase family protein [Vibrio nigripulchritudo]KJY78643.1 hypothetical protein TW74_11305 [Vibrio nigripulchritudo]
MGRRKVLVSGSNGYVGRHVVRQFESCGWEVFKVQRGELQSVQDVRLEDTSMHSCFDAVVNCARPHWSEHSPDEIASIERTLLTALNAFAKKGATKIHTSGVWLFGKANPSELNAFQIKPFDIVAPDEKTIYQARQGLWKIVYCPSLIYGGESCQLFRILSENPGKELKYASPSHGFNRYVHVEDVAAFYQTLVESQPDEAEFFIAEEQGYTPEDYAKLLHNSGHIEDAIPVSWEKFEQQHGKDAADIEKLSIQPVVTTLFRARHSLANYLEDQSLQYATKPTT